MPGLFGSHNDNGDYTASQFSVQQHIMHCLGEQIDHQKNWLNVEICLLIEAGTTVTNESVVSTEVQNQMMIDKYHNLCMCFLGMTLSHPVSKMTRPLSMARARVATQVISCGESMRTGGKNLGQSICQSYQRS